jgi:hypothetical protein
MSYREKIEEDKMSKNYVAVSKDLKDGRTDFLINGIPLLGGDQPGNEVIQTNAPGKFVIADNQSLVIKLVDTDGGGVERDPRISLIKDSKTFKFYIKLESYKDFDFNICMNESGWTISQKCCLLSSKTVLISLLPEQINIWPVRLLLLPIELVWKVLQFIWALGKFIIDAIIALKEIPGNTNITVGGEA